MSKIFLMLFFTFLISKSCFGGYKGDDFIIMKDSQLLVHGKANIIKFTCLLKNAFDSTPFTFKGKEKKKRIHLKEGKIVIPTKNLDCGTRGMNKDMWKLLKAKEHPNIVLDFLELQMPVWKKSGKYHASSALSEIQITIAGKPIVYPIHLNLVKMDEKNFLMSGSKKFRITDFGIKPRNYLLGLIKLNELIEIDFELFLKR